MHLDRLSCRCEQANVSPREASIIFEVSFVVICVLDKVIGISSIDHVQEEQPVVIRPSLSRLLPLFNDVGLQPPATINDQIQSYQPVR